MLAAALRYGYLVRRNSDHLHVGLLNDVFHIYKKTMLRVYLDFLRTTLSMNLQNNMANFYSVLLLHSSSC